MARTRSGMQFAVDTRVWKIKIVYIYIYLDFLYLYFYIMLTDLLGERRSDLRSTLGSQWSKGAGTGARAVLSERLRR